MQEVKINKANALKAYNSANKETKALLESLFGKEVLSEKITDRVKTIGDVLEISPLIEDDEILFYYQGKNPKIIGARALLLLEKMAEVLNEGWTPDWTNENEYKYYPYFEYKRGVGFSGSGFVSWHAGTSCGSRLCFKSSELALYAGKQFEKEFKSYFLITKTK